MAKTNPSKAGIRVSNILFGFFSLSILVLSACILAGCRTPQDSNYRLFSINASSIGYAIGKDCARCQTTNLPDRYMFGLSGTCRSTNETIYCQRTFPNTFNVTNAVLADMIPLNSSDASSANAAQSELEKSKGRINHALVFKLAKAVSGILISSVIVNCFLIPIRFVIFQSGSGISKGRSRAGRVLYVFVTIDWLAHLAAIGMSYELSRAEIAGIYAAAPEIRTSNWQARFELGFWLLLGAAACRPLNFILLAVCLRFLKEEESNFDNTPLKTPPPRQGYYTPYNEYPPSSSWTPPRDERPPSPGGDAVVDELPPRPLSPPESIPSEEEVKPLPHIDGVDEETYAKLTSKLASTIRMLRTALESYTGYRNFDGGCMRLLESAEHEIKLAAELSIHFNQYSTALFLGITSPFTAHQPGQLLWQGCPNGESGTLAPESYTKKRGVYMIELSECCHDNESSMTTSKYRYVGSSRRVDGVMGRLREHTDPEYRTENIPYSRLYSCWERDVHEPCISIYLLADWQPVPAYQHHMNSKFYDDILLMEAIWQVVLDTTIPETRRPSPCAQYLREEVSCNIDSLSGGWEGLNICSALESSRP